MNLQGTYVMPAIPPFCAEKRVRVEVVEWRGDRVLLRELCAPHLLVDTPLDSVELDLPPMPPLPAGVESCADLQAHVTFDGEPSYSEAP